MPLDCDEAHALQVNLKTAPKTREGCSRSNGDRASVALSYVALCRPMFTVLE